MHRNEDFLKKLEKQNLINALGEHLIMCPKCGAGYEQDPKQKLLKAHCPACSNKFCTNCNVVWHTGITCAQFNQLQQQQDAEILNFAQTQKWMPCPQCKEYVDKESGCNHMTCRCATNFCYLCGKQILSKLDHYSNDHPLFHEKDVIFDKK